MELKPVGTTECLCGDQPLANALRYEIPRAFSTFLLQASLLFLLQQAQTLSFGHLFLSRSLNKDHNFKEAVSMLPRDLRMPPFQQWCERLERWLGR